MEFEFERWEDGRWFVVFPDYPGGQEDLEMVEGADKMLDALTSDGLYVVMNVYEDEPAEGDYFTLKLTEHDDYGGYYLVQGCELFQGKVWLCNVVHEFYPEHPEMLYVKLIG